MRKTDDCWEWTGGLFSFGYGSIKVVLEPGRYQAQQAHRVSYELHHGPIPAGLLVCHRCDNPICVRPDHLFLGTNSDNMRDMHAKGRANLKRGATNARAKLSEDDVREIRALAGTMPQRKIAARFGISQGQVCRIVLRTRWASA